MFPTHRVTEAGSCVKSASDGTARILVRRESPDEMRRRDVGVQGEVRGSRPGRQARTGADSSTTWVRGAPLGYRTAVTTSPMRKKPADHQYAVE